MDGHFSVYLRDTVCENIDDLIARLVEIQKQDRFDRLRASDDGKQEADIITLNGHAMLLRSLESVKDVVIFTPDRDLPGRLAVELTVVDETGEPFQTVEPALETTAQRCRAAMESFVAFMEGRVQQLQERDAAEKAEVVEAELPADVEGNVISPWAFQKDDDSG